MSEKKIRGGSLIARALKDKGIQHVFTLSGGFCNPALEGFTLASYPVEQYMSFYNKYLYIFNEPPKHITAIIAYNLISLINKLHLNPGDNLSSMTSPQASAR